MWNRRNSLLCGNCVADAHHLDRRSVAQCERPGLRDGHRRADRGGGDDDQENPYMVGASLETEQDKGIPGCWSFDVKDDKTGEVESHVVKTKGKTETLFREPKSIVVDPREDETKQKNPLLTFLGISMVINNVPLNVSQFPLGSWY